MLCYLHPCSKDSDEPAWVREYAMKEKKESILRAKTDLEERLKNIRDKEAREKVMSLRDNDTRAFKKTV